MNLYFKQHQRGQTLLEAVIALSAILLIIAAVSIVVSGSLNNAGFINNQNQASKYAQDGIEYLRYLRNTDSATFITFATGQFYCMNQDATGKPVIDLSSSGLDPNRLCSTNVAVSQAGGGFKRAVQLTKNSSQCVNKIQANVVVLWSSGKCSSGTYCHTSALSACFDSSLNPEPTL